MEYPFKFNELLLTSRVLDKLGFTEYWNGSGYFGTRRLIDKEAHDVFYELFQTDEMDDPTDGYDPYNPPEYQTQHYCTKDWERMYFLHELYEDFLLRYPDKIEYLTKQIKTCNMYPQLKSYLKYKEDGQ
jgi:hypothetical protein